MLNQQNSVNWLELGKVICLVRDVCGHVELWREQNVCIWMNVFFKSKRRSLLIVRLKTIKSGENIFCYLFFYLRSLGPLFFCIYSTSHYHYHYPKSLIFSQVIKSSSYQVVIMIIIKYNKQVHANLYLIGVPCCW